ncbi:MAG TPA: hypothetical protein VMY76_01960 [Gemmatimonadales bacterium]|nr:hypothetical protein [Gemmatimonadales bacterium]
MALLRVAVFRVALFRVAFFRAALFPLARFRVARLPAVRFRDAPVPEVLFRDLLVRVELRFRAVPPDARFRPDDVPALRFRVAAAFRADADFADFGRDAEARPPVRPPLRTGAVLVFLPRPEPRFRPPPDTLFSVAQARRSASFFDTPRLS